ncbi:MAG: hypothetical protein ACXWYP_05530 [Pseudonocardia sp.]
MSSAPTATAPVDVALLASLVDDAAVFPPGNSPLDVAVEEHIRRARTPLARFVGPLLVPAAASAQLVQLARRRSLRAGLIARPGSPLAPLHEGIGLLHGRTDIELAGVEAGWAPSWRDLLAAGVPVTVEIPRDGFEDALDDVAAAHHDGARAQAKYRTGATATWAWPDEHELAGFVRGCLDRGMPFKLTGGLHHAVRADHGTPAQPDPQHGLLNVLLAVQHGRSGADAADLATVLADTNPETLSAGIRRLSDDDVAGVRQAFTAYGCCTVTDPLGELDRLGLLPA